MYIDPTAEPLEFLLAAVERLPILVLGELGLPPAEVHYLAGPGTAEALWVFAALVMVWWLVSIAPLLGRDPLARFWAFGGAASFVLVCSTHPHNRMLFYPSLGVLPLLATVWHGLVAGADWMPDATRWRKLATGLIAPVMAVHLVLSPLLLPLAACSIWFPAAPIERGLKQLADDAALSTRELVVVTAPEYFFVKLLPVVQRLQHAPVPARLRALSFGPVRTTVTRRDASTLDVHYAGGILQAPYTRLYRDPRIPMHVGETIALEGLRIEVTDVTPDGRLEGARFRFDGNLADGHRRFVYWDPDAGFVPFRLPAPGQSRTLPAAGLPLSI